MVLHVSHHRIELLAGQAGHGAMDEVEVIATVEVVKNIHHGQPVAGDLRAAAVINDGGGLVHCLLLGRNHRLAMAGSTGGDARLSAFWTRASSSARWRHMMLINSSSSM